MKYHCRFCNYIYSEEKGEPDCNIPPKTLLKNTPYDFECPLCHTGKDAFIAIPKNTTK